ncbi:protein kinase C-binding protein NELL2-like [Dreissena polymorpha]|uniref:protein kinase C-binding protein NELL2-like n=1 Tax=Dreissena polymorpha TaxID=45954 RepID=UPI0022645B67|nr:protein kinase C-binding protein NELL2-like [Dreissena polymorpha]
MWGQLIIALACALEILAQDCEDPARAVYLNLTSKMYDINGTQYNATKFEDQATVTCAKGYRLIGKHDNALVNETINCMDTGKWSQIAGCEKKDCEDPTRAVYLNLTSKMYDVYGTQYNATKFEDQATVTCASGYRLIGKHDNALVNETINCTDTGKWSQIAGCEKKALCSSECQNGGTCVSPDVCECPKGYNGLRCENETKNCTLEAGQNVNYWHMSTNTTLPEGEKREY